MASSGEGHQPEHGRAADAESTTMPETERAGDGSDGTGSQAADAAVPRAAAPATSIAETAAAPAAEHAEAAEEIPDPIPSTGSAVEWRAEGEQPPLTTGSAVGASTIPAVRPTVMWMEGAGACPHVYWTDMTQVFASALESQWAEGHRVAKFTYCEHLAAGPIVYTHDFEQELQINESTGQRKRLRRVEITPLVVPLPEVADGGSAGSAARRASHSG